MQPAIQGGHGMWFVTGVDDGPLKGRLKAYFNFEGVGPLGYLEPGVRGVLTDSDPARPAHHLSGHEERDQVARDVRERRRATHEVVLVRTVGRALAIGAVLVQVH